jgi:hypothetical protein
VGGSYSHHGLQVDRVVILDVVCETILLVDEAVKVDVTLKPL